MSISNADFACILMNYNDFMLQFTLSISYQFNVNYALYRPFTNYINNMNAQSSTIMHLQSGTKYTDSKDRSNCHLNFEIKEEGSVRHSQKSSKCEYNSLYAPVEPLQKTEKIAIKIMEWLQVLKRYHARYKKGICRALKTSRNINVLQP